jgi:methylated-DNA-[protein]-cysteine S-methyltransferase
MPQLSMHSPVGDLTLSEEDGAIVSVDWGWSPMQAATPLLQEAKIQLDQYFDSKRHDFDLPLAPAGTVFQKAVWAAMRKIPFGATRSYGDLARTLDSAPRAIGQACGRNVIPILIPCHRVLGSRGSIGGYSGGQGLETKRNLLRLEGADF